MSNPVLHLDALGRVYHQAGSDLAVLKDCTLSLMAGEMVALIGPSGSGKSTLLHSAGLLEKPDAGRVWVAGVDTSAMGDAARTTLRRRAIGFVYQFHHLLPEFSARENIMLPQMIAGVSRTAAAKRADDLLKKVGLNHRADHRPARLSGGEQQRVALARALANAPQVLIADEPTGNLDPHTAEHVFALLSDLVRSENLAVLMATHNHDLAHRMGRVAILQGGSIAHSN